MTSEKLKKLEDIVKPILEESWLARNDDFYLYGEVVAYLHPEANNIPLFTAMRCWKEYGLPNIKSIERVRRKLQAKYPELESERTRKRRLKESVEYKHYAAM